MATLSPEVIRRLMALGREGYIRDGGRIYQISGRQESGEQGGAFAPEQIFAYEDYLGANSEGKPVLGQTPWQSYNMDGSYRGSGVMRDAKWADLAALAALSAAGMGALGASMGGAGAASGAGAAGAGAAGAGLSEAGLAGAGAFGGTNAAGGLASAAQMAAGAAGAGGSMSLSSFLPSGLKGWADLMGPITSLAGGAINASAASSAAGKQAAATDRANALLQQQGAQVREDLAPYRNLGSASTNRLMQMLGDGSLTGTFGLDDFYADPSYEFRRNEGMRGIENSAAARGSLMSGGTLKALNRYNSDLASQEWGNAFNRDDVNKRRTYNFLAGGVSTGQNAAAQTGNAGMQVADRIGANTTSLGDATAASTIARSNALAGGLTGAYDSYRQNELVNRVLGGNASWGVR